MLPAFTVNALNLYGLIALEECHEFSAKILMMDSAELYIGEQQPIMGLDDEFCDIMAMIEEIQLMSPSVIRNPFDADEINNKIAALDKMDYCNPVEIVEELLSDINNLGIAISKAVRFGVTGVDPKTLSGNWDRVCDYTREAMVGFILFARFYGVDQKDLFKRGKIIIRKLKVRKLHFEAVTA